MHKHIAPAQAPISIAGKGLTKPDAGVMATSPATQPEMAPRVLGLPPSIHSTAIHASVAAAAPKWVATNALVARPLGASALPALKPNQPTHNMAAPMVEITRLCGFMSLLGKPMRLPR